MSSKRARLTKNRSLKSVQLRTSILPIPKKRHELENEKKKKHQYEKDTIDSIMNQCAIDQSSIIDDEDPTDPSIDGQDDSVSKKYDAFSRIVIPNFNSLLFFLLSLNEVLFSPF